MRQHEQIESGKAAEPLTNQFLRLTEEGPTVFVFPKYEEVVANNLLLRNNGDGTFDGTNTNPMINSRDVGYSVGGVFGDYDAHFGLGDATVVDTVRIEWPSGIVQELEDVRAKQFLTVVEPAVQITKPQSGAEGFQMTLVARKGTEQSIEVTSGLVNWTPLATVTNLDRTAKFLDPYAHALPQRFYRVVEK